jgi:hypothetical protein
MGSFERLETLLVRNLMALATKHHYWMASSEENAAIGLEDF